MSRSSLICLDLRGGRIRPVSTAPEPAVLCLGNFDGVHLAHAALLEQGRALAGEQSALCGVFCFFRPSGDYFLPPGTRPTHLTTLKERILALQALGAEVLWLCDFPAVQDLPPQDFMRLLTDSCGCVGAVCGYNHRFGKNAEGTPALLSQALGSHRVLVLPPLEKHGAPISSSRIRACLLAGETEEAAHLLGRPYTLKSKVLHGKALGHTWGFPTANQSFPADRLIPALGVYAVRCHTPLGVFPGVANVGLRPTVEDPGQVNCETHIIGLTEDLYGKTIRVEFWKHLRREQRFPSREALVAAIRRDTEAAAAYIPPTI